MTEQFKAGSKVIVNGKKGIVVRPERKFRQDGYMVRFPIVDNGDGYGARFIPAYLVKADDGKTHPWFA